MQFPLVRQILLATFAIMFACTCCFGQQRSSRESAGIKSPVRTVRIEGRQLLATTYHQSGVMVYTIIYDDKGRVLENAEYLPGGNPDTKYTSVYDERGREIEHANYVHDELLYRSITRYDARNRKLEQISFDGNGKQSSKFVFQYDKRGRRLAFEVEPDSTKRKRSVALLDRRGNELERTEYSQTGEAEGRYVYTYDAARNKTSEMHYYQLNGRRTSKHTYVFDNNGNLIEEALYFDGALDTKKTYARDEHGNQIEAIETDGKGQPKRKRTWSYEFDGEGNWTRAVISEWTNQAPEVALQPTYEYRRTFSSVNDATIALWRAAQQGNTEQLRELLRRGADVTARHPDGGPALIKAAARGHSAMVQELLTAGAQVDSKDSEGWTALAWAAEFGRIETVKVLLSAGADPNSRNEAGGVPIMPAAQNGFIEVVNVLLEKGAEVNAAAGDGSTALMVTAREGQSEAVKLLLTKGADPNLKTTGGLTALFFAATGSNTESVNALLENGADINSRANGGATPLMFAAERSELGVLQLLIEKGAEINAKTDDGRTALSIAVNADRKEAAELLRKAGAK